MKSTLPILIILLSLPCRGDEVVLRDGKRLPWKTLTIDGESYVVEAEDGKRLTLKKSDIERIEISRGPTIAPLTGANFVMDKKAVTVDLLPKAELGSSQGWKQMGRALVGSATWPTRSVLTFDYELPEEYDLSLSVERVGTGTKDFAVGVVGKGGVCAYHFDAWDASKSVLALIAGQEGEAVGGRVFQPNKSRLIKILVRKAAVAVHVDGKEFWKGSIDWKSVSTHPAVTVREKKKPFVVAAGGTWNVSFASVTSIVTTK